MRMARHSQRTITTLQGVAHLVLKVYRCRDTTCPRFYLATRPEEEGRGAVPHGEFGLDVIALVGALRYQEQRNIPQIHQELQRRGGQIAGRTVTDHLYRYEELLALSLSDVKRLRERLGKQEQVILALDGLQPDVGHEVLWVLRDCCSTARNALSVFWEGCVGLIKPGFADVAAKEQDQRSFFCACMVNCSCSRHVWRRTCPQRPGVAALRTLTPGTFTRETRWNVVHI